jgi:predicted DNA-binding ribbon-helix-helix protein
VPATNPEKIVKHSVSIAGHRTSISLEAAFWDALKDIAAGRGLAVAQLIREIDLTRQTNLSSAIRVFILARYR